MEKEKPMVREQENNKDKVFISNNNIGAFNFTVQEFSFLGLVYMDIRRMAINIFQTIKTMLQQY